MHPRLFVYCRRFSKLAPQNKRRRIFVKGVSAALISAATGGVFVYYQYSHLTESLSVVSQSDVIEKEKSDGRRHFIYVDPSISGPYAVTDRDYMSEHSRNYLKSRERSRMWFSWLKSCSHNPITLLSLAQSDQHSVRLLGVQALASQKHWCDAQYLSIAQACDKKTLVGLARSVGVDRRYFLDPPGLPEGDEVLEDQLRRLLGSLPTTDVDKCTNYFTSHAIAEGKIPPEEREGIWSFDGNGLMRIVPILTESTVSRIITFCIQALYSHSQVPSHCPEIVKNDGLQTLQRVLNHRGSSIKIRRNIARIMSNIALHESLHSQIVNAGWVSILLEWLNSSDLPLSMLAGKALANLDLDFGGGKYADGVHLYYPQHRFREPVYADIVFVHGLLGGPFRTWRQKDPDPEEKSKKRSEQQKNVIENVAAASPSNTSILDDADEVQEETRTECWPKDWLAEDYPHMRLLTLEYETHLSEWAPKCPFGSEKRSLAVRSAETLKKLKEAGLGKRPIIWVGHSMGGLIIKNMLVTAAASHDPLYKDIVQQSKGIIFYAVPHRGSPLAARSAQTKFLLYPSVEVEELRHGSVMLRNLHKSFTELMFDTGIPLLSFGEGKKSSLPFNFKMLIVPPESSNPGFGEYHIMDEHNHLDICKPKSKQSQIYQLTLEFICDCIPQNLVDNILRANMMPDDFIFSEFMN